MRPTPSSYIKMPATAEMKVEPLACRYGRSIAEATKPVSGPLVQVNRTVVQETVTTRTAPSWVSPHNCDDQTC